MLDQFIYELCEIFGSEAVSVTSRRVTLTLLEQDLLADTTEARLEYAWALARHYSKLINVVMTDNGIMFHMHKVHFVFYPTANICLI